MGMVKIQNDLDKIINKYGGSTAAKHRGSGRRHRGGDAAAIGYTEYYVNWFDKFRTEKISFLEIGVFQGRSLAMWSDYFTKGIINAIDIDITEFELMKPELIKLGAFTNNNLGKVLQRDSTIPVDINLKFDIIIDDGAHTRESQFLTFKNFYRYLNSGGIYIIEDIYKKYEIDLILDIKSELKGDVNLTLVGINGIYLIKVEKK